MAMLVYQRVESFELPPKLYCPKMEYRFFLRFKGSPSFYKGFDQTFTDIRAISRSHHFELMAAAMAKVIKTVPGCARISAVTRRSDAGARRSNSGSASSRSRSSSSGRSSGSSGSSSSSSSSSSSGSSKWQQDRTAATAVTASHSSSYQQLPAPYQHHQQQLHQQQLHQQQQQSRWCRRCWCFAGAGKTNACSKSTTRPRSGNGSCRSSSRMGKKVCLLLARFMPSCLSWILPSFLPSFWLRSRTQNQTGKRNRRMKRILARGKQKLDKM